MGGNPDAALIELRLMHFIGYANNGRLLAMKTQPDFQCRKVMPRSERTFEAPFHSTRRAPIQRCLYGANAGVSGILNDIALAMCIGGLRDRRESHGR
jgi:hypothetical protein